MVWSPSAAVAPVTMTRHCPDPLTDPVVKKRLVPGAVCRFSGRSGWVVALITWMQDWTAPSWSRSSA